MKKIRVLHVVSSLANGGVENMLKNYYDNIDKEQVAFDFIVHNKENCLLEKFFLDNGSKIFYVTPKKESFIKNFVESWRIIKDGKYDVIHCHQNYMSAFVLMLAKIYRIPVRIVHTHVMINNNNKIKSLYKKILTKICYFMANYYFACSNMAGKNFFKKRWNLDDARCYVMRNAMHIDRYKFNPEMRKKYRKKYDCGNSIVLLSLGRIEKGKNLDFIVHMMEKNSDKEKYKIYFVGNGTYEKSLKNHVKEKNIKNIFFIDSCYNVEDYYSMADIFLFPSISEGLGMVAIEAQLNGLPVIASKNISEETNLGNIMYLDYNIDEWNNRLKVSYRKNWTELIDINRYNIEYETKKYQKLLNKIVG